MVYELGTGTFGWHRFERQSDRYGTVGLWDDNDLAADYVEGIKKVPLGTRGALRAEVLEQRESGHIGDLARGIDTRQRVDEGNVVTLGEGTFIRENYARGTYAGVQPYEPRDTDWLDPKLLYQLHDSEVRLFFETEA
jgi:hypothetical protein